MGQFNSRAARASSAFSGKVGFFLLPVALCASAACGTAGQSDPSGAAGTHSPAGSSHAGTGTAGTGTNNAGANNGGESGAGGSTDSTGSTVSLEATADEAQELKRLQSELDSYASLDAATFAQQTAVPFGALASYDPASAPGMDLVQKSTLALNSTELAALSSEGFVVAQRQAFPSFMYGYATIYAQDLPLYISADSILYAVHRSYDAMLQDIEATTLIPNLTALLDSMSTALGSADVPDALRADTDVYLATARSLLAGRKLAPLNAKNASSVATLYQLATSATAHSDATIFRLKRDVDFSQFAPRGHYLGVPALEQYFRAMIWLGRMDLRVIETQEDGSQVFEREQLEGAVVLRGLMSDDARSKWASVDATITAFVGEHDDMTPPQIDSLLQDLNVGALDLTALSAISDTALAQAVIDGGYGAQRIASQIMINGPGEKTLPLARTFAFLGQRYTLDSNVFANVVYDRVIHEGAPSRMMPSPLDVAYAAFGNDQAGMLLDSELTQYAYAPELRGMRALADEHGADFWQGNLYNLWLSSLRTLSPTATVAKPADAGLPSVTGTESWGRRLLNTQLASWSELRHDTLLYAKPSYTGGATCQFPTAYVDPYPEFFSALADFATKGEALVEALPSTFNTKDESAYFQRLGSTASTLRDMASDQRQGLPLSAAHLEFVNQTVTVQNGCGSPFAEGWYPGLFYSPDTAIEADPTIADVHTQPTDEAGNDVGHVLHVAAGAPHLMVVTVDGCTGSQAYVGLASSYYEQITDNYQRLTDVDWAAELGAKKPPAPPAWLPSAFTP